MTRLEEDLKQAEVLGMGARACVGVDSKKYKSIRATWVELRNSYDGSPDRTEIVKAYWRGVHAGIPLRSSKNTDARLD